MREQLTGEGACRDARRRFPRARALENVPEIRAPVLRAASQVRVSGSRPRDGRATRTARVGRAFLNSLVIVCCQLTQSRFSIISAIGPPSVSPARMPEIGSARSDSIAIRRPRP